MKITHEIIEVQADDFVTFQLTSTEIYCKHIKLMG